MGKMDREQLKSVLRELARDNRELFEEVAREVLAEKQDKLPSEPLARRARLESLIRQDFDEFNDVFTELA